MQPRMTSSSYQVDTTYVDLSGNTLPYNNKNVLLDEASLIDILRSYGIQKKPTNINHYRMSMVHKSYCIRKNENILNGNEYCPSDCLPLQEVSNERLEYLGDSVLSLIVASYLYERYPNENEGFLTKIRTRLVNGNMLAHLTEYVNISPWLIISHQIEENEGRKSKKILEDALEALIGAIYMDFDFEVAKEWVINLIEANIDFCDLLNVANYKDNLFKSYQFNFQKVPIFEELGRNTSTTSTSTSNLSCNSNSFRDRDKEKDKVTICVKDPNGSILSIGYGTNKKDAENDAAKNALTLLGWMQ